MYLPFCQTGQLERPRYAGGWLAGLRKKELEDGSIAVGLFNLTENNLKISAPWPALKINGKQMVRDVWQQKDIGVFSDKYESTVPPHGVVLVRISKSFK